MQYLVLDIETVVDERVWTPPEPAEDWRLFGELSEELVERRDVFDDRPPPAPTQELSGWLTPPRPDPFPPPFAWRPICIGCVLLERGEGGVISVVRVGVIEGTGTDAEAIERSVLQQFAAYVGERRPNIVTWNGRHFDMPVLMLRSMRLGIPQAWWYGNRETRYRYTEDGHCDLMDAMCDHGAADRMHLDGMAKLIGLPGKFGDIGGKEVAAAFAAGRLRDIGSYCMSDAVQTAFLWLRWHHLWGHLSPEAYRQAAGDLLAACEESERLAGFVALVDRPTLLLEPRAA